MLQLKRMPVGQIGTNCYLLQDPDTKLCAVVDPGDQPGDIYRAIEKAGLTLSMILLTHGHFDHVLGVPGLLERCPGVPVYVHTKEVNWAKNANNYMLFFPVDNMVCVSEGDTIPFGDYTIQVLHTPGHSPGSLTFLVGDVLLCGDTLFAGSCGRTDFQGGSYGTILKSLKRLVSLPGNLRVCPGHEGTSTLDAERETNPFVREALR